MIIAITANPTGETVGAKEWNLICFTLLVLLVYSQLKMSHHKETKAGASVSQGTYFNILGWIC